MSQKHLSYLDKYKEDDIDAFSALLESADVMQFLGGPMDIDDIEENFEDNLEAEDLVWAVRHHQDHVYMGHASLEETENFGVKEIMILLAPNYWGYGHGTDLLKQLVDYGREAKDIEELHLVVDPRNNALQRVCQKAGLDSFESFEDEEGEVMLFRIDVHVESV